MYQACFSPDGRAVTTGDDGGIRVWDAVSGKDRGVLLRGQGE
jgi:WD40 repeat protein